ncbi:MAG: hypothetical protein ACKO8Z_08345, partial [Prosthecobacter sp.]
MRWLWIIPCALLVSCANPAKKAPEELQNDTWMSFDGKMMPWQSWNVPQGQKTHAALIAIHGLSGATSDFWPLGEHLSKQGTAVY